MSTRYVWGKYTIIYEAQPETVTRYSWYDSEDKVSTHILGYCCKNLQDIQTALATGKYTASGATVPLYFGGVVSCESYPYFLPDGTTTSWMASTIIQNQGKNRYWHGSAGGALGSKSDTIYVTYEQNGAEVEFDMQPLVSAVGTLIGNVASNSQSSYPTQSGGAASGSYWYTYLGSDSIDPAAVSYSANTLKPGESITVTVTPRSNTYGGTISYLYQYSTNSGSTWASSRSATTATSKSIVVPSTAKQFQVRVLAQDDMGYTSTTYVTGTNLAVPQYAVSISVTPSGSGTVSGAGTYYTGDSVTVKATPADGWEFVEWQEGGATASTSASYTFTITASCNLTAVFKQKLTAWIGVSGKARKGVELYVGVNGKARKVTGAWIGVNGKARRFL